MARTLRFERPASSQSQTLTDTNDLDRSTTLKNNEVDQLHGSTVMDRQGDRSHGLTETPNYVDQTQNMTETQKEVDDQTATQNDSETHNKVDQLQELAHNDTDSSQPEGSTQEILTLRANGDPANLHNELSDEVSNKKALEYQLGATEDHPHS